MEATAGPQRLRGARLEEHQRLLITSAVGLVASGGCPRVVVAGMRQAERAVPFAQEAAARAGVVARAVWRRRGCDIAIEAGG